MCSHHISCIARALCGALVGSAMTARVESAWWVVTDLDGTLLDHSYDWSPAKDLLRQLQQRGIPVIPCTSKTAEEVRAFRAEAELHDPYIVENGGAVHSETSVGEPWELPLGPVGRR